MSFSKRNSCTVPRWISLHSWVSGCRCTLDCFTSLARALRSSLRRMETSTIHTLMLHDGSRWPKRLASFLNSVGKVLDKAAGIHATKAARAPSGMQYLVQIYARAQMSDRLSWYVWEGTLAGVHPSLTLSLRPCTKTIRLHPSKGIIQTPASVQHLLK